MTATLADEIADCAHRAFNELPAKRKPRGNRPSGQREWVPLSTIVLCRDGNAPFVASLATGMKSLPASKVALANGLVLHDCHAEILALRAFNHFLIQECTRLAATGMDTSNYMRRRSPEETTAEYFQPFELCKDVRIIMYCSEAPCGDASMEVLMESQPDAIPWEVPTTESDDLVDVDSQELLGRGYFSKLGIVRRKPARGDALLCHSKSCSDKLSLKQCTSILTSPASLLINPRNAYLDTLILPKSQYNQVAIDRAFGQGGRMSALNSSGASTWKGGYAFRPFRTVYTTREFIWSRRGHAGVEKFMASNISAVSTPLMGETIVNGVLQGRKMTDSLGRGASLVSRRGLWSAVAAALGLPAIARMSNASRHLTYGQVKNHELLASRRQVKADVKKIALKGWRPNNVDDTWRLSE